MRAYNAPPPPDPLTDMPEYVVRLVIMTGPNMATGYGYDEMDAHVYTTDLERGPYAKDRIARALRMRRWTNDMDPMEYWRPQEADNE